MRRQVSECGHEPARSGGLVAVSIDVNPVVDVGEWQAYVERHPDSSIFHLPQWKAVLDESFPHKPMYIFARDTGGRLCGLLPMAHIRSRLTGHRLVSLPFAHICGPIADTEATLFAMVDRAFSLCKDLNCRYIEIRTTQTLSLDADVSEGFSTYVLELSDPERIWKMLHMRRRSIRKAKESGVNVKADDSVEGLRIFDVLNQRNKRDLGVPAQPPSFLTSIHRHMKPWYRLYLAEVEGKPLAGIVTLSFKDTVNYAYGASDPRYLGLRPNDLAMWHAIEESCNKGFRHFDFGKTAQNNLGLVNFKKHWGTMELKLRYYTYPKASASLSSGRTGKGYQLVTGIWRRLPLPVTRILSPVVFRHLD